MSAFRRRGACPTLAAPMATGDGLLARFSPPRGALTPEALEALAGAAGAFGNGVVEVTNRGALQVRGLREETAAPFGAVLHRLGVAAVEQSRVVVDPLAGLGGTAAADPRPLAEEIDGHCAALPLAPKVAVAVDGGSALHLDALPADLRLRAFTAGTGVCWELSLNGRNGEARCFGAFAPNEAAEGARRVLALLASHGGEARARDLVTEAVRDVLLDLAPLPLAPSPRTAVDPVGVHATGTGVVLGVAGAFGSVDAEMLAALAREAAANGARGIRPAPGRALLFTHLDLGAAMVLRNAASRAGLVTEPGDPRRRVAACPGSPACGSGQVAARALAALIAAKVPELLDGTVALHVSGCAKGCAHPGPAALTLVGADGACDVVLGAGPRGAPLGRMPPAGVPDALRRLDAALAPLRRGGCGTAAAMAALGREGVLSSLLERVRA